MFVDKKKTKIATDYIFVFKNKIAKANVGQIEVKYKKCCEINRKKKNVKGKKKLLVLKGVEPVTVH